MKALKMIGLALMATLSGIPFSACTNDTEEVLGQDTEIKLTSEITAPSRGTSLTQQSTQIVAGQKVGVTITGAKSEVPHQNIVWTAGTDGALTNTGETVYYNNETATITAYHPHNAEWTGTSHTFSVSTDQSTDAGYLGSDLLWTTKTASKTESPVALTFKHKLAKINVTLVPEEEGTDLSGATISICGTNIATNFTPSTGDLSAETANVQEIKAGVTTNEAKTASAIVIPQTVSNGTNFIKVAHGGKTFYYKLTANQELKSGYSLSYTLTVKENTLELKLKSENITDWDDEGNIIGDAEEIVVEETLILPSGLTFNQIIGGVLANNSNLKKIKFVANSNTTSESILVTDVDGTVGYIVENEDWLEIHTIATKFVADRLSCTSMFSGGSNNNPSPFRNITDIEFGNNFDTSNATGMYRMFYQCYSLTSLDLSGFNTSQVTNMEAMFYECSKLTTLDISNFDTSKIPSMEWMFSGCQKLQSLNLSHFNTSQVTNMGKMFYNCYELATLNLNNFDTSKVTDMSFMFASCKSLTSLEITHFNTTEVNNMSAMFSDCYNLETLDVANFTTSNVTNMNAMFAACKNLTTINVSDFNTSKVEDMMSMFAGCEKLSSLDLQNFDTSNVTNMSQMFSRCINLTSLSVTNFDTSKVTNMMSMFQGCEKLTSLDLQNFVTSNVTNMHQMFNYCPALTSLNVTSFDTSKVTDMGNMFLQCKKLESLNITKFKFDSNPSVTNMLGFIGSEASAKAQIQVSTEGYTYLTATTTDCGIDSNYAQFEILPTNQ